MYYLSNVLFFCFLILGTVITLSSSSWFMAWVGLEVNLLSFIPIMMSNNSLEDSDCSIKYFLVQSIGSIMLLVGVMSGFFEMIFFSMGYLNSIMLVFIALLMKLGVPPFHYWLPEVSLSLNWLCNMILLIWQKLGSFVLLGYILSTFNMMFVFFFVFFSMLLGGLGGLNQISLKKLMVFSSINHMGWMLMGLFLSFSIWLMYYLIYFVLSMSILMSFWLFKLNYFSNIMDVSMNILLKMGIFMNMLSLGGLPPFLGFFPKWLILEQMIMFNYSLEGVVMVLLTMISLYFYLRLIFMLFVTFYESNFVMMNYLKLNIFNYNFVFIMLSVMLNFLGLFLMMIL